MTDVRESIKTGIDYLRGKCRADTTLQERVDWALEALDAALVAVDVPRDRRRRLPDERESITRKVEIAGHDFYINVGLYPDDRQPGEVFVRASKEGSTLAGLLDTIGILFSISLQYGVPLRALTDKLSYSRFEPAGFTGFKGIEYATSPVDFLARWLAMKFLPTEAKPVPVRPMVTVPPSEEKVPLEEYAACADAPACERCGHLMRRMGSNNCWVCGNCAATSGSCGG